MRKVEVILIDDIDGSEAERTVKFGLDGTNYEIDLSGANITELENALTPFIKHATKTGRRASRPAGNPSQSRQIREWAKAQGIAVPDRGRIPATVVEQFTAAH